MPYKINFIGLTCFVPRMNGDRRALLPDGRFPDSKIEAHTASIAVRTGDLRSHDGWPDGQVTSDDEETEFFFNPSTIEFPFPDKATYAESAVYGTLPNLNKMARQFAIGSNANWIANIPIANGSFEAFRVPGLSDPDRAPLLAELTVDYGDEIVIDVTPRKGWPTRRIVLAPGSEIAVINTSRGLTPGKDDADHFQLYAELSSSPVELIPPRRNDADVPFSTSSHPTMTRPRPATFSEGCVPVTGGP